jgi:quercetin dioxygenase-like cupin family protein
MRTTILGFLAAGVFAADSPRVPINNEQARVVVAGGSSGGKKGSPHDHKVNRVMVYLDAGRQINEYQDGHKVDLNFKAGDVIWSPASGMHTAQLISAGPVRIVEVEIKRPGSGVSASASPLDPPKVDKKHYKVEMENDQVRVMRARIGPRESTPLHEHSLNRVVVYLTDQKIRVTSAEGKVETLEHKAGEVVWSGPAKHKEENLNETPFEVLVVEFKS